MINIFCIAHNNEVWIWEMANSFMHHTLSNVQYTTKG